MVKFVPLEIASSQAVKNVNYEGHQGSPYTNPSLNKVNNKNNLKLNSIIPLGVKNSANSANSDKNVNSNSNNGMRGNEEVTGLSNSNNGLGTSTSYSYNIDFTKLEKGSDLWLFYQITDFGEKMENLQVVLTPGFDGRVWYTKDPVKKTLTIQGSALGEVSYRFTANRYDWKNWTNLYTKEDHPTGPLTEKK